MSSESFLKNHELIKRYHFLKDFDKFFLFLRKYDKLVKKRNTIRLNPNVSAEEKIINSLKKERIKLQKIDYLKNAYFFESNFSLSSTISYLSGEIYQQSIPSMLVSTLLDLKKDDLVLDMAAAPGSKTTHIAQILENSGLIVAVDNNHNRVSKLINNLERMNVKNTVVICCDILEFNIPLKFNKILIDAPCSGNFMLEKEWFEKRKLDDIYQKQEFQKEIIKKSVEFTKPNTKIVYSTCSLEKEENEEIIDYAIKKLGYKLIPIKNTTPFKSILWPGFEHLKKGCLRFWPHHTNQEGFFMCVLEKR